MNECMINGKHAVYGRNIIYITIFSLRHWRAGPFSLS